MSKCLFWNLWYNSWINTCIKTLSDGKESGTSATSRFLKRKAEPATTTSESNIPQYSEPILIEKGSSSDSLVNASLSESLTNNTGPQRFSPHSFPPSVAQIRCASANNPKAFLYNKESGVCASAIDVKAHIIVNNMNVRLKINILKPF